MGHGDDLAVQLARSSARLRELNVVLAEALSLPERIPPALRDACDAGRGAQQKFPQPWRRPRPGA